MHIQSLIESISAPSRNVFSKGKGLLVKSFGRYRLYIYAKTALTVTAILCLICLVASQFALTVKEAVFISVFNVLCGIAITFCLERGLAPVNVINAWDIFLKMKPSELLIKTVKSMAGYPLIILGISFLYCGDRYIPPIDNLESPVLTAYISVNIVGMLIVGSFLVAALVRILKSNLFSYVIFISFIERIIILQTLLLAIRYFHFDLDYLFKWGSLNPDHFTAIVLGALATYMVFSVTAFTDYARRRGPVEVTSYGKPAVAQMTHTFNRRPSKNEIAVTAVHEAGHLLLYSALPRIPVSLKVEIMTGPITCDSLQGYVHSIQIFKDQLLTESWQQWSMLLCLAGSEAELVYLGERDGGAYNDMEKWLSMAEQYLLSGFGDVYYASVETQAQSFHNRNVLNNLKESQRGLLYNFLLLNKSLLLELAQAIERAKTMNSSDIKPYLDRVVLLPGMKPIDNSKVGLS